jgi:hypothetical protein
MPVAQRGAQDDCQKFTVGGSGTASTANNGNANANANGNTNANANTAAAKSAKATSTTKAKSNTKTKRAAGPTNADFFGLNGLIADVDAKPKSVSAPAS